MRVAMLSVCLNPNYWPYIGRMIESAKTHFLPGHEVEFLLWTDMPPDTTYGATVLPTAPVEWPLPTLMRYHLYLQQVEKLKEYDYLFHCDADMLFVDTVGDEIFGDGITAALHPMYDLKESFYAPFEPNPLSAAYVPFPRHYFAGGFQGGTSEAFIKAMWSCKRSVDYDFDRNYVARWNEESHWNKYLFENPPSKILSPEYVYPDSLINEYYLKIWPKPYKPKLVTLTKQFTTTSEGGAAIKDMLMAMQDSPTG